MEWNKITKSEDIDALEKASFQQTVLLYKHSSICGVSSHARQKIENGWKVIESMNLKPYFVDVISQRSLSRTIAEKFGVVHQSPQVLLIQNGESIFDISHLSISIEEIEKGIN